MVQSPAVAGLELSATLSLQLVTSRDALALYRDDWNALAASSGVAHPFLVWEWVDACFQARRDEPACVLGFDAGQLALVWPLARRGRVPGRRRLVCAGVGPSDYQGVLVRGGAGEVSRALEFLMNERAWDFLDLTPLDAEQHRLVADTLRGRTDVRVKTTRVGATPFIALDAGWEARAERAVLKDVQYQWRRFERLGGASMRLVDDIDEAARVLDWLIDLHIRKRLPDDARSAARAAAIRGQLHGQAAAWRQAGLLRLHALYLGGHLVAAHMGAQTADRFYYYLPVFDPQRQQHSPGKVLLWRLLHEAAAQGLACFDLLRGDEPYKAQWGAIRDASYWRVCVWRNSGVARLLPDVQRRVEDFLTRHPAVRRVVRSAARRAGA